MIEIPLTAEPDQTFNITVDGQQYTFIVRYNTRYGIWTADILQANVALISGVGLLAGVDIFQQFPEIMIKNVYVINLDDQRLDASADNLGTVAKLFILTEEEISGATV